MMDRLADSQVSERTHYWIQLVGDDGPRKGLRPLPGATVELREWGNPGSFPQSIYATKEGSMRLLNPLLANAEGIVEFWLDEPLHVQGKVTKTGYVPMMVSIDGKDHSIRFESFKKVRTQARHDWLRNAGWRLALGASAVGFALGYAASETL